jgi:hypothetical protein
MRTMVALSAVMMLIFSCSSGGGGGGGNTPTYSVGGLLSGLSQTVVLQNNGADDLSLGTNGPFTFPASLADGTAYNVTVKTQPSGQICVIGNGTGTISGANVTSVTVTCNAVTSYTVGGDLSGLTGMVTLQNNGTDDLTLGTNSPFTFPASLADGTAYDVTVKTQPSGQICVVGNGAGTISGGNVTNVTVTCYPAYSVGGVLSGLTGTVTLQNNGTDDISIGSNGSFIFPALVADGAPYQVTVKTQPSSQVCTVGNGSGLIPGANVINVTITCEAAFAWDEPVSEIDGSPIIGVGGYRIYYGTSPGVYTGSIDVGSTPRFAIADFSAAVPHGATYYISVTAYDADKTTESSFSNEITMTNN